MKDINRNKEGARSFSAQIKDELSKQTSTARHCQIAEIAAIISFCGQVLITADHGYGIKIHTENIAVARKYFTLLQKTFNIEAEVSIKRNAYIKKNRTYMVMVLTHKDAIRVLQATKLLSESLTEGKEIPFVNRIVIQNSCCRRAFIRGAFLVCGSISAPEKFYHFEIACLSEEKAKQLREVIKSFDIDAKIVTRKKYFVVYIKEGSQIVDILNVMEAHIALMEFENVRILKDMRNSINRQVNCETANISKTVSAAVKQIEDIKYIRDTIGFGGLSEGQEEIARIRLENPNATLKELGEFLDVPIGKSGVNHRLKKLSLLADTLRAESQNERKSFLE